VLSNNLKRNSQREKEVLYVCVCVCLRVKSNGKCTYVLLGSVCGLCVCECCICKCLLLLLGNYVLSFIFFVFSRFYLSSCLIYTNVYFILYFLHEYIYLFFLVSMFLTVLSLIPLNFILLILTVFRFLFCFA